MSRKPNSTILLFVPKGLSRTLANCTSRPVFVAAIAKMKPPINSMMTGSAKVAITPLYDNKAPTWSGSHIHLMPESLVKSSIRPMTATDVAHDDTISIIHISVANAKMAMIRCCTTVRFCMPYHSVGKFHKVNVTANTISIFITRLNSLSGLYLRA